MKIVIVINSVRILKDRGGEIFNAREHLYT